LNPVTNNGKQRRKRLAVLVNTIAPYRLPIYEAFSREFQTLVLHGGSEANRNWNLDIPGGLETQKVLTVKLRRQKITSDNVTDTRFVHFNAGLLWWIPAFRPDVIVSNEMGSRTILGFFFARLLRVPFWVWWEGTPYTERYVRGWKLRVRRFLARHVEHWASFGNDSTKYLRELGVPEENILQVQNCVPHENFERAPDIGEKDLDGEPRPILLAVGQLIARKGIVRLIDACGRQSAKGRQFTLLIAGDGPRRKHLETTARNLGLEHVHFLSHQSQERLNSLYRHSDAFIFPTLEDVWGLVVNEAILAGCPVLCSRYAGCAEDLLPPQNIFDPLSQESFDLALDAAIEGRLAPSDPARLISCDEVARRLIVALKLDLEESVAGHAKA